jgi:hypothetical protein
VVADLHRGTLEAARVDQLVGETIGDRILEVRARMTEARWRAWLCEESLLPRALVERYLHVAGVQGERREEQEILDRP